MRAVRTSRAFTLIELLVVIGIIVTLTSFLAMGLSGARDKAQRKNTRALIDRIKVALESYNSEFRDYPPDGYDKEPLWDKDGNFDAAKGVRVGPSSHPNKIHVKGTAALLYFLCRPHVKITYLGSDGDRSDPRNQVLKTVGPFLELEGDGYFSKKGFNPNHPWSDTAYWTENATCEILDGYGRPLCYDKVKTKEPKYFNPELFCGLKAGIGVGKAHPDAAYADAGLYGLMPDAEDAFGDFESELEIRGKRVDPRYTREVLQVQSEAVANGSEPAAPTGMGTSSPSHEPKYRGGYDLWSSGRSWIDFRDDVTSWGE